MPNPLVLAFESALSALGIRSQYEQPRFESIAWIKGDTEVRRYGPRLAAEVSVPAPDEETGRDEAFKALSGYIFGANRAKADIAMTAPVAIEAAPQPIATAPVEIATPAPAEPVAGNGALTMRFFLPAPLTLESAPIPEDGRVRLLPRPGETLAVRRFSGAPSPSRLAAERRTLLAALAGSPWRPAGQPITFLYDPPFTLPFRRRNEVAVAVEKMEPG